MNYENFFTVKVPLMLQKLDAESKPCWGSMNASQMLVHLAQGVALSMDDRPREIITPEAKLPSFKKFLMSDKPFMKGAPQPQEYDQYTAEEGSFLDKKVALMRALLEMQVFFSRNPGFSSVHPNFGRLSTKEWTHLHWKHIRHHFEQFNIPGA